MPTPVLICDDSNLARKQIARCLPDDWDIDISFAENGAQAIEVISMGQVDVLFLDLNMPVMDGYEVLEAIQQRDLPTLTIVVSGDIQPAAHDRVMSLGALDFIRKPIDRDKLAEILDKYGVKSDQKRAALKAAKIEDTLDARDHQCCHGAGR
jgi:CheY-like chemotaxis protein